jgi:peptidoglycan/LPS O-acetylase OafA/YrhL
MAVPSAPVGIRPSTSYLPEVESLRGIAIVLVYAFHLNRFVLGVRAEAESTVVTLWYAFLRAGHTGVSLFFVLSGFLLSLPFLREAAGGPVVQRGHYYGRRALRILPLYYAAVLVGTVLTSQQLADLWRGVPYLFFLNAVAGLSVPLAPYSSVWWSLATEAQYYLLLPLLPLCLRSRRGRIAGVVVLAAYAAAYGAFLGGRLRVATIQGNLLLALSLFGRAPLFLLGIAAAWVYQRAGRTHATPVAAWRVRRYAADAALLAAVCGLGVLLQWWVSAGPIRAESPPNQVWHVVEGGIWAAVLLLVLLTPIHFKSVVCNRVLGRLGVLSYSIYMWHVPVILLSLTALRRAGVAGPPGWQPRTAVIAAGLTAICLVLSALTYRWIERPFLVRKARID